MTRSSCSRAARPSGCSNTMRMAEAIMLRAERGTRSWALRVRWTRQRAGRRAHAVTENRAGAASAS